ncbi:pre-miRNA 5'-monophosphate methyltransferase [Cyprinus carpio]|uniref:RNA methyltransferase n=1 Tax=Cyprinus carpio TaxID=7962 RepID=A0A9Q9XN26_CYPCA|nr:pre-miRNA 5'-monophosphate methyltransferase [Cyprinus carpio]
METRVPHVSEEENQDPGAAPYGNFVNYYTFNPPENRLSLIPGTLLENIGLGSERVVILDVGCNSGVKGLQILISASGSDFSKREVHLLGFDLDQDLILRAQNSNPFTQNIQFIPLDITDAAESQAVLESYLGRFGCPRFQLCTCFAVTMWVHLNHGDAAFFFFFFRIGFFFWFFLLEAQPWKCYRSAARRLRKLGRSDFDHFKTLEIRGDMAAHAREHLEKQCSMDLVQSFGNTAWDRSLLLFKRR